MYIMHTPKINESCKARPQVIYIEEQIDAINCPKPIKQTNFIEKTRLIF